MPHIILCDTCARTETLKSDTIAIAIAIAIVKAGKDYPVAILNHYQPAFYCVPAELYELIPDALDDKELVKLVHERSNQPLLDVDLDALL